MVFKSIVAVIAVCTSHSLNLNEFGKVNNSVARPRCMQRNSWKVNPRTSVYKLKAHFVTSRCRRRLKLILYSSIVALAVLVGLLAFANPNDDYKLNDVLLLFFQDMRRHAVG